MAPLSLIVPFLEARASLESGLSVTQSLSHSVTHSLSHTLDSYLCLTNKEGQEYFTGHVGHTYHMVKAFPTSH